MLIRSLLYVTGLLRSVITLTKNKQTKKKKKKRKSLPNKISLITKLND